MQRRTWRGAIISKVVLFVLHFVARCTTGPRRAANNLLGRAQPVIPPNLYVNEHNSLGSPGNQ